MCERQTLEPCHGSISSAGDSRVRISVTPEKVRVWTANARVCGSNISESFATFDPESSSWRTSQRCLEGGLTLYSDRWPKAGTTQYGQAYELPMLALRIDASGCSLWPTASATDYKTTSKPGQRRGQLADAMWPTPDVGMAEGSRTLPYGTTATGIKPDGTKAQVGLGNAVKMWPTPDAAVSNDGENLDQWQTRRDAMRAKGINGNGCGTPLAIAARLWPTPTTQDSAASGSAGYSTESGRHAGTTLTDATARRVWATPRNNTGPSTDHQHLSIDGQVRTATGKLNPAWVEQLMGFPDGWTDVGPPARTKPSTDGKRRAPRKAARTEPRGSSHSETPSCRSARKSSAG